VKQVKAFLLWDSGLKTNPARTASAQEDYHKAGGEIRRWLLDRPRADLGEFERAKAYIEERYLDKQGGIDETKPATHTLIENKARRIWKNTQQPNSDLNWWPQEWAERQVTFEHTLKAA